MISTFWIKAILILRDITWFSMQGQENFVMYCMH